MDRYREWKKKSTGEQILTGARNNKTKVGLGAWMASVGGYYAYLKQDTRLSEVQRMAKMRTFTLIASVVLLGATTAAIYADSNFSRGGG